MIKKQQDRILVLHKENSGLGCVMKDTITSDSMGLPMEVTDLIETVTHVVQLLELG